VIPRTPGVLLFAATTVLAANPELLTQQWSAHWITVPGAPRTDYGVYHFRRSFSLQAKPASFVVHVSADNRYQLFVNGERVSSGPARGDLMHWRYETVDLAPQLKPGANVLAAVVWNFGPESPMAQVTHQTAFLLQGDTQAERMADTNREWKCAADPAYSPIPVRSGRDVAGYYVSGPGERVDASKYPWGWETASFDDRAWLNAEQLDRAAPRGARDAHSYWMMVPRPIPPEEERLEPPLKVRRSEGVTPPSTFPQNALQVPAGTRVTLILDQGYETTGYPELAVSGGAGATISLRYAESLYQPNSWVKGNRNEVNDKVFKGYQDIFDPDGGSRRTWRPLWWRTWRYIELSVETKQQPLTIESLATKFTGYPFERRAKLETKGPANEELQDFLDVSWRTLRVDAHETFMDCAYYEQLQYVGDTRLEALATLTLSGDPRLVQNAIRSIHDTQTADGLTYSRGPSRLPQYIPPFSLLWIGMVHDYWMYQDDPELARSMLPGVRSVLSWFQAREKPDGSLGRLPWWNYVDWVRAWQGGVPPTPADGGSAILDLQHLAAIQQAADLEEALGSKAQASEYRAQAERLSATIRSLYYDSGRRLFADTPEHTSYSQHANAFAILTGVARGDEAKSIAARLIEDKSLTESTLYFRYYIHTALLEAGLGDRFLDLLGTWREALRLGLTTWPEQPEPSRSDAHAWSSHIAIDMFRTMLGIRPLSAGFKTVRIAPHLGKLDQLSGTMPHPRGEITVAVQRRGAGLEANVTLPPGVSGELAWAGQMKPLEPGTNRVLIGQ
jgi:alpha-L-rhamnosidase